LDDLTEKFQIMKKILVPCDFSPTAQQAYTFALDLAKKVDAEVYVLRVIDVPFMYDAYSFNPPLWLNKELWKKLEDDSRESFNKMKAAHSRQHDITFRIVEGAVTLTILDFIDKEKIDLVVMGTHGASGFDEIMLGSNTEKVVRFSKVPVIAIRRAVNISSIKDIVFPTDLALDQQAFINKVKELQELFGATLHILSVNTPHNMRRGKVTRVKIEEFAKYYGIRNYTSNIRSEFTEESGIIDFTAEIKGDMIAMATHGRRGLAHFFSGSIAENTVNHIACPVWTLTLTKNNQS
jgi:nucleotide-binding universal stress UspA family protein